MENSTTPHSQASPVGDDSPRNQRLFGGIQRVNTNIQSPSVSLIQSAVRSILDDATPSTILSDDNSDHPRNKAGSTNSFFPSLESLRMERPPPIPSDQDRKCFLGCLATVLACSYEYDVIVDDDGYNTALNSKESFSYGEALEDELMSTPPVQPLGSVSDTNLDSMGSQGRETIQVNEEGNSNHPLPQKQDRQANHRKRRYEVFCRFLILSSELLLLDESVSKAFLPLLADLLVPRGLEGDVDATIDEVGGLTGKGNQRRVSSVDDPKIHLALVLDSKASTSHEEKTSRLHEPFRLERVIMPFLESMSKGSGFRCVSLFLLQHLLTSEVGYDARIRYALKKVAVVVLMHEMSQDPMEQELVQQNEQEDPIEDIARRATRKFEAIERGIARRIIRLSEAPQERPNGPQGAMDASKKKKHSFNRESILRGVKIGSAGIVAGTLFALTGGLAAPGIAAGVAAVTGSAAAATAALVTLTSTAVVTTIFGVGGGSLAAYKMQRRTQGLTEFEFTREAGQEVSSTASHTESKPEAELFTTICISGWLRDAHDFQRPWGIHPSKPRLRDPLELLQRFYYVLRPDYVANCPKILNRWKGEEDKLWKVLRQKYGRDPDSLFPLPNGPRLEGDLTVEQQEVLDLIFVELGYNSIAPSKETSQCDGSSDGIESKFDRGSSERKSIPSEAAVRPTLALERWQNNKTSEHTRVGAMGQRSSSPSRSTVSSDGDEIRLQTEAPRHLETVWDFSATYAGELYTVRWESNLLRKICECVMDLAMDLVTGATRHILKQTVLSTLLAAVIWPSYVMNVANLIDEDWTLAVERADEAGKELAKTLLLSRVGQRPVTLLGYSFGARVVYSCLKELARLQDEWAEYREEKESSRVRTAVQQHRFAKLERQFNGMREPCSIVEDAIIMGLPNHLSVSSWRACRLVVAGRLVNCYSTKDLILSLMFQAKRFSPGVQTILKPVCGTCSVNEAGVENVDVSDLVQGHQDYCLVIGKILQRVKLGEPRIGRKRDETIAVSTLSFDGQR